MSKADNDFIRGLRKLIREKDEEVERLRAALQKIAGSMIGTGQNSRVLVEIAKEALND